MCCTGAALAAEGGAASITADECREQLAFFAGPAFQGRGTGTPEGYRAGTVIAGEFAKLGLHPAGTDRTYFQPFAVSAVEGRTGRNVLGLLIGSDPDLAREVLIISAHYDHLPPRTDRRGNPVIFPGADDNGSGLVALLELAEAFVHATTPPRRSILFAAWDAEENQNPRMPSGLQGSGHWAANPTIALEKIAAMFCMDMLSRDFLSVMHDTLYVVGTERSDELRAIVQRVDGKTDLHLNFAGADIVGPRSDHWHFFGRQIPFLFFSTSQHKHYHTPRDTPANARIDKLVQCTRAIYRIAAATAAAAERPTFRRSAYVGLEELRALMRVSNRVIAKSDQFNFRPGALGRLKEVVERGEKIIASGTVTPDQRRSLAMAAGMLLLSQMSEKP